MINVYHQEDFSFCQQRLESQQSINENDQQNRYSSPEMDTDDQNDLHTKLRELDALSREAFFFHHKKQKFEQQQVTVATSNINCCFVCCKTISNFQLIDQDYQQRKNYFKGSNLKARSFSQLRQKRNVEPHKNQQQSKFQYTSYFSVPNRDLCYSILNA